MKLNTITVEEFLEKTASSHPTPGGGCIASVTAATAVALAEMVANLTLGKKGYDAVEKEMIDLQAKAASMRHRFLELAEADMQVFNSFMEALKLPKSSEEEKLIRQRAIQECYKNAALVPYEVGLLASDIFSLAEIATSKGNQNLVTDGAMAAINARAALVGAFLNVRINLASIKDQDFVDTLESKMQSLEQDINEKEQVLIKACGL